MLVPVNWIKEYTDIDVSVTEFCDRMILSGSNIETVEEFGKGISGVVVGKVVKLEKHPDADKLFVTMVDTGQPELLQIVTGAPNLFEGAFVPVVTHGGKLPSGITIKKGKLRGVMSHGMLCSMGELGYEDKVVPIAHKDGIMILEKEYPLGMDIVEALKLDESVVDFEITPNRPDCLSMLGMAREAAAVFGGGLKYPATKTDKEEGNINDFIQVEVRNNELCPRYMAKVIKDVKIGQSPWWLQRCLIHAGMRPINNIVDITNFVMMEYGQPMHAFDIRSVAGSRIIIDTARDGEVFTTLDGIERKMYDSVLMINDAEKPIGIAGIMGGLDSEIKNDTKTVVLESANFNGDGIRSSSKKLALRTEASSRYEKGIDANLCEQAADRFCRLVEDLRIGTVVSGAVDIYPVIQESKPTVVRVDRINNVLGIELSGDEMVEIFNSLEMKTFVNGNEITVIPPTVRQDLLEEVDYIEEVARMYGYDKMPVTLPQGNDVARKPRQEELRCLTRDLLTGLGVSEIQTYSFVSPRSIERINISEFDLSARNFVKILNPLGEENSVMRTMLTPNMMEVLGRNYARNNEKVSFFELGSIFNNVILNCDGLPTEAESLVIAGYGQGESFYTLKGIIVEYLNNLGIYDVEFEPEDKYKVYHPGRCAYLIHDGKLLGTMGEIHPDVSSEFGIGTRVYCCELSFTAIAEQADTERFYSPLPRHPAVTRDIALLTEDSVKVGDIEKIIRESGGELLESVELFDIYKGKQVGEGYKSVAFALKYRDSNKTLTDEEVSKVHERVLEELKVKINAVLREV